MLGLFEQIRAIIPGQRPGKRWVRVLLLFVLIFVGLGIGTFDGTENTLPGVEVQTPEPALETPTPTLTSTPTPAPTSTPTPNGLTDSGSAAAQTPPEPTPTPTATPPDNKPAGDGSGEDDVEIAVHGSRFQIRMTNALPGDAGAESVVISNSGNTTGRLGGDVRTSGELSESLLVRLSATYEDGTTEYLSDSEDYVPLSKLDGETRRTHEKLLQPGDRATLTFEWKLPHSTGNEAQNTSARFDFSVFLEGPV